MIKVGIFFGGKSREREVSFAGGRTVYDNLDKRLFEAVPIFVDANGNMVKLNWQYIYRGTIRDFYPPVGVLPASPNNFQVYSECLQLNEPETNRSLESIGSVIQPHELKNSIDLAFLALHGSGGEDGSIQGLLEWYNIPYTGSGLLPSAIGMNKALQKVYQSARYKVPAFQRITKLNWQQNKQNVYESVKSQIGFPCVIKPANQGSSIGVSVLKETDFKAFTSAVELAFFRIMVSKERWHTGDKIAFIRQLSDLREGLGMPVMCDNEMIYHPEALLTKLNELFEAKSEVLLEAVHTETEVLVEAFISGKEFSCIVVEDDNGQPVALPPTEIVKNKQLFDYKSKYLPGLSRKITPIDLPVETIEQIRNDACSLYDFFGFNVYARIDGFYADNGDIFLNDPNTTSGMMPSSFFFHQAAEIGLNPSQFLTFIIRNSLRSCASRGVNRTHAARLLDNIDEKLKDFSEHTDARIKVAVIMGGYSTERHISVESGRNIYEKLASSAKYRPIPVFLTGNNEQQQLYMLPVNMMLKDNADDIKYKVEHYSRHPLTNKIMDDCRLITQKYTGEKPTFEPVEIAYNQLPEIADAVFIALHGRPGEDGAIQKQLEKFHMPYNGSGIQSSSLTINKYLTNNLLRDNGFLVADSLLITKNEFNQSPGQIFARANHMGYPFIAKPSDEGCSSAVVKINNEEKLKAYAALTFREKEEKDFTMCQTLGIQPGDEFPMKDDFLLETFISKNGAAHFLEITGGMLTSINNEGNLVYQVFEASEALAEGEVLSLAEKFLAGEGQNITPARYHHNAETAQMISNRVKEVFEQVARLLNVQGYCRIDAFVRVYQDNKVEVIIIEINSLPGMTPATCIYHQAAIENLKPFEFIDKIITFGIQRNKAARA